MWVRCGSCSRKEGVEASSPGLGRAAPGRANWKRFAFSKSPGKGNLEVAHRVNRSRVGVCPPGGLAKQVLDDVIVRRTPGDTMRHALLTLMIIAMPAAAGTHGARPGHHAKSSSATVHSVRKGETAG